MSGGSARSVAIQQRYRDQPRGLRSSPKRNNGMFIVVRNDRAKSIHHDARPNESLADAGTNDRTSPLPGWLVMIELFEDEAIASGVNE